jgi:hypothetical protein
LAQCSQDTTPYDAVEVLLLLTEHHDVAARDSLAGGIVPIFNRYF